MQALPDDSWYGVLRFLQSSPRAALMLSWTCKHLRNMAISNPHYWLEILRATQEHHFKKTACNGRIMCNVSLRVPGICCRPEPNFKCTQQKFTTPWCSYNTNKPWPDVPLSEERIRALAVYCRRIIALKIETHCCLCKTRWRHVPLWSLRMRVCIDCIQSNMVSNVVLFHRYGVDFWKHLEQIVGKVMYFISCDGSSVIARRYSLDAMDFGPLRSTRPYVFFWRPHLDAVLDLQKCKAEQDSRRAAGGVLVALVRRLLTQAVIHLRGRSLFGTCFIKKLSAVESLRAEMLTYQPITMLKSPHVVISKLRAIEVLRIGRLITIAVSTPPRHVVGKKCDLFEQWQDRLVEADA